MDKKIHPKKVEENTGRNFDYDSVFIFTENCILERILDMLIDTYNCTYTLNVR